MKKHLLAAALIAVALVVGLVAPASATEDPVDLDKVGVCHRTGSEAHPYVFIEVPPAEANGHITGTSQQHNQMIVWPTAGTWRGVAHAAGDLRLDYLAPGGSEDCEDENAPPPLGAPTALLSTPTCENPNVTATGVNPGEIQVTFDVFVNGVFVGTFDVGADNQGSLLAFLVKNGDVVTVKLHGSDTVLATRTVSLVGCGPTGGGGGGGGGGTVACPGTIRLSNWFGDPQVNIRLKGAALFKVTGGIQRSTGRRVITADLACDERFRIREYKVKKGHHLRIFQDGVKVVDTVPPVLN